MAFTYAWSDAITLVNKMVKGIPTSSVDAFVCNQVSNEMYGYWPWQWTVTSFGGNSVPLADGVQDYTVPANIYRLLRARILRTDVTPNTNTDLTVRQTLPPDLVPRSYTAISAISLEEGIGQFRLESAVSVTGSMALEINGEFQINPTKVTSTSQQLWFPDEYMPVACEGLLYWNYKLADDPRAGGRSMNSEGKMVFSGQYGAFMAALQEMARAEDYPATESVFPDDCIGIGRQWGGSINLFGAN